MIEETVLKTLEHAPALLVVVVIVSLFLRFLKQLLDSHAKRTDEFLTTVRDLNADNIEARGHSQAVIEKCTEQMTRVAEVQKQNTDATKEMTEVFRQFALKNTP